MIRQVDVKGFGTRWASVLRRKTNPGSLDALIALDFPGEGGV